MLDTVVLIRQLIIIGLFLYLAYAVWSSTGGDFLLK